LKIIKFYAEWCGPCKVVGPIVEQAVAERGIELENVNIDENPEAAMKYHVRSIPTVVIEREGKELTRLMGTFTPANFNETLDKAVAG